MNSGKTVTIIGGGIAGLSAAVFLAEKDHNVKLIEASPKLGGRAYSFYDKEKKMFFDNGQHILAGWYKNTFEYLKLIGSHELMNFQKELEVNFINTEKKVFRLKCPDAEPPMNLLYGLLKFGALGLKDKFALKNVNELLKNGDELSKKYTNVRDLLKGIRQTENLIRYFWEPFTLAVFNTRLEKISSKIFLNVLKTGFGEKDNSTLVIPGVDLKELLIDKAVVYLEGKNVQLITDARTARLNISDKVDCVRLDDGTEIRSDYYISAVPFFSFKKMFDENIYVQNGFKSELIRHSGIVSVHLFFREDIPEGMIPDNSFGMTGLIGTIVQWIFKRSSRHLSLVISGADDLQITEMKHEEIFDLCLKDLRQTINGFDGLVIEDHRIIKEKRATFIPDKVSEEFRPKQKTKYGNFFIAGDWTDTGMPATIESAVTSARICAELVISN